MKKILALFLIFVLALSVAACSSSGSERYDIGNADRARVFYNTYTDFVNTYGEGKEVNGNLCGTAVVRLKDFTGDGYPEMLIAYSDEKDGEVNRVKVWGFDMGLAEIFDREITSKSSKSQEGECLWIYTDVSGLSYLVLGDDLSTERSYEYFQQADKNGKDLYEFAQAFSTDGTDLGGSYEKIELKGNTDSEAIFKTNKGVVSAMKAQKN